MWQSAYEDMDFNTVDSLWADVKPLYDELHKYVRNKLSEGVNGTHSSNNLSFILLIICEPLRRTYGRTRTVSARPYAR